MGQRHQVMVVLPRIFYNEGNVNNRPERVVAIHHQWLYGSMAVHLLDAFVKFFAKLKANSYTIQDAPTHPGFPFDLATDRAEDLIPTSYKIDKEEGYYHRVSILDSADPEKFDNNDGVTVIDLRTPSVAYCFFSIHGYEGNGDNALGDFEPHSYRQYLKAYGSTAEILDYQALNGLAVIGQQGLKEIIDMAEKQDQEDAEAIS